MCELDFGRFGTVFKVKNIYTHRETAVKKIQLKGNTISKNFFKYIHLISDNFSEANDKILREVKVLAKTSGDYVVQYYDSWIENNEWLYIQMELCSQSLQKVIEEKIICFQRNQIKAMNSIEFYISCQLFRELLECVQYIHGLNPQIIHRDHNSI